MCTVMYILELHAFTVSLLLFFVFCLKKVGRFEKNQSQVPCLARTWPIQLIPNVIS